MTSTTNRKRYLLQVREKTKKRSIGAVDLFILLPVVVVLEGEEEEGQGDEGGGRLWFDRGDKLLKFSELVVGRGEDRGQLLLQVGGPGMRLL